MPGQIASLSPLPWVSRPAQQSAWPHPPQPTMSVPQVPLPPPEHALPFNSTAEPDQLWLSCNIRIDIERFAKKHKQKKVSIVMKRTVCRLVSKESWYMGYKGVCGIKIDLVLRLIQ